MKRIALLWPVQAAVLLGLWGCGADLTLPGSPPAGLAVAVVDGDDQTGTVGEVLPEPVVVEVKTDGGQPLADRRVAFVPAQGASAGRFDPDTAVTDAQGRALTSWYLGTAAGLYTAEVRLVAGGDSVLPAAPLQATAGAGAPDTLRAVGPSVQGGRRGQALDEPLVVIAVDRFGNPVGGVEVVWDVPNGNGDVSARTTPTGSDGTASVVWTLGNRVGVQRVTASVNLAQGSPVTFVATVLF
ncbi:MAG: Ig-like domain-containing protein [Gemmatimonadales bacterium]